MENIDQNNNQEQKPVSMISEQPSRQKMSAMSVPAAIVFAGVIVALAILYSNGGGFGGKQQASTTQQPAATAPTATAPTGTGAIQYRPISDSDHIRGDKNAPVKIIEYSDLQCPYCQLFHPTMTQIYSQYQGQIAWVYRHFPLTSIHPHAELEAEASECANELGGNDAFWKFVDRVFTTEPQGQGLDQAGVTDVATYIGLDKQKFTDCVTSGKYAQKVQLDEQDAISAGGQGTPYSVVISKSGKISTINGALPLASVQATIQQALAN